MADTTKVTKLHQLLGARDERKKAAAANIAEVVVVFEKKASDLFMGTLREVKAVNDARGTDLNERSEKQIQYTVHGRLEYLFGLIGKELDVTASVDASNQTAKANITIGDRTIATGVPAVTLLALEDKLKEWMKVISGAPTRATGHIWELDPTYKHLGPVYKDKTPTITNKTEKIPYPFVLAPATDKFAANVIEKSRDEVVAKIESTTWSGMIRSEDKARIMTNLHELLIAVKAARNEANEAAAIDLKIGDALIGYIFEGAKEEYPAEK